MNKAMLRSIIILHGETSADLSAELGISAKTFSAKINARNGADFTQSEMLKIKTHYNLTADEIEQIFFTQNVS